MGVLGRLSAEVDESNPRTGRAMRDSWSDCFVPKSIGLEPVLVPDKATKSEEVAFGEQRAGRC